MAVVEMQKEPRSIKAMLFIVALIVGFLALAGGIYWLMKPAATRTVKLSGDQAKQAESTFVPTPAALPPQPPIPQGQDPGPTLITLDLKQVTPRQAIAEVASRAKVNLNMANIAQQGFLAALTTERFDISYKNETFWSAMIDLCKKGRLTPYADYQQPNRISFMQGNPNQAMGPTVAVGSCVIVLENITSRFDANLTGGRPANRDLRVGLKLYAEPKLSPYRISTVATLETAVDEKGTSLIRPRGQYDDRSGGGGPQSNWMREVNCLLIFPENAGDRIAKLKGYCTIAVAGPEKTEKIEAPLTKKNHSIQLDGVSAQLVEVRRTGSDYYVRMAGDVNSPVFKDYERMQNLVKLIDANGKEFQRSGGSYGGGRAGTFEFGVNFSASGMSEPKELHVTLPTGIKEIRVPFEFNDLPLPH